jgi:hypothetical protein
MALLESKTKDLPSFEARRVKRQLKEASVEEIEKKFDKTLKSVREDAKAVKAAVEEDSKKTVESEIEQILSNDMDEDDMLKNRPHNLHKDENLNEEDFETTETVNMTETGDVELDESEVIDGNLMKLWCRQAVEVN